MTERRKTMTNADGIPAISVSPQRAPLGLILHLPAFGQKKEETRPVLDCLAELGFVAVSIDSWQHGERGTEDREQLAARVFGNFRRNMWPILGQTALDVSRVLDWALAEFDLEAPVTVTGLSMGGDIAIAAAGIDPRIERVVAFASTPDWLRPGMRDAYDPLRLVPPGEPALYARFFYDHLDPLTHPDHYAHAPRLHFVCGEKDTHIPPSGAVRFKAALAEIHPEAAERVSITLLPELRHLDFRDFDLWRAPLVDVLSE